MDSSLLSLWKFGEQEQGLGKQALAKSDLTAVYESREAAKGVLEYLGVW